MSELKKCPFCGGKAIVKLQYAANEDVITTKQCVVCKVCGAAGITSFSKEYAIEAWNERKPVERALQRLEEVGEIKFQKFSLPLITVRDVIEIIKEEVG